MDERKKPEKPLSPEILKLTDKLVKDPKSRLFVPLAEEYLKAGLQEEAVVVLTDGLKIHPNLHAARTVLGKVYLEKGQIAKAKEEFEHVVKADPENLLAHRRLARLYKDGGELDKARVSCQAVLSLNPKDAEMRAIIEELNRIEQARRQRAEGKEAVTDAPPVQMQVEQTSFASPEQGREPTATEPILSKAPPSSVETVEPKPPSIDVTETHSAIEEALKEPEPARPVLKEASVDPSVAAQSQAPSMEKAPAVAAPVEEITSEGLADLYIKQGHYEKGIAIYRRLLAKDPENSALFKKLDETVELVRLLNEGPQIKPPLRAAAETAPAPAASSAEPVPPSHSKESSDSGRSAGTDARPDRQGGPAAVDRERQKMQKIHRLQAWLDSIKKGQDQ